MERRNQLCPYSGVQDKYDTVNNEELCMMENSGGKGKESELLLEVAQTKHATVWCKLC